MKRFDPGTLGRTLMLAPAEPRRTCPVWAMTFATMQAMTGTRTTLMRADALLDQGMISESIEDIASSCGPIRRTRRGTTSSEWR